MKIAVIIPATDALVQAGVRIRYKRMAPAFAAAGHQLTIATLAEVVKLPSKPDVLLFSKCYDARAMLVARSSEMAGSVIGIDLFDDVFSQVDDSRFALHRAWLQDMRPTLDFILVSTERMACVASSIAPGIAVHRMNDPASVTDQDRLARRLAEKAAAARERRELDVAWFGIGDNPHFPVGLADVTAYADMLVGMRAAGWTVKLRLLTNLRALSGDGLALIRRLPFDVVPEKWSEAAEVDLLESSLVAFLPVNAQPFSIAKSLNRAVTALQNGTQILSAGYPLYQPFSALLYRSVSTLIDDLEQDALRLRADTVGELAELLQCYAAPEAEAHALVDFLASKQAGQHAAEKGQVVLFGTDVHNVVHDFADKHGILTAVSPFVTTGVQSDIRFAAAERPGRVRIGLSPRACSRLASHHGRQLSPLADHNGCRWLEVGVEDRVAIKIALAGGESPAPMPLFYDEVMSALERLLMTLFPDAGIIASEARGWLAPPPAQAPSASVPAAIEARA